MTNQDMRELNERLLQYVGFIHKADDWGCMTWFHQHYGYDDGNMSDFTSSMDACITWIIPKLKANGLRGYHFNFVSSGVECTLLFKHDRETTTMSAETAPLALCLTVDKYYKEVIA